MTNDGVHRVEAGGRSKNRKPAGSDSVATLCDAAASTRFTHPNSNHRDILFVSP
jgi:hypothetical protein